MSTTARVPLVRPYPAAGQVWSAAAPKTLEGRRYLCIIGCGGGPNDSFVHSHEVDRAGVRLYPAKTLPLRTALEVGEMPTRYRYEPTITASIDDTPDEGTNGAARRKETTMSTNHTETVPATTTLRPPTTKVPGIPTANKTAAPKAKPAPKAAAPKPTAKAVAPKAAAKAKPAPKKAAKNDRDSELPAVGCQMPKDSYNGKAIEPVRRVKDGFTWKGEHFDTIHEVARKIRHGKPTNGYEFFFGRAK